ncbi:SRPBCC family protein [Chitinophaga lutea]|nr:SRPBCC family protein [Chitinophaga lutea]
MDQEHEMDKPQAGYMYENSTLINVSKNGRILSAAAGAALLYSGICGIGKKPVNGLCQVLAGGYLLYRGISGNCPIKAMIEGNDHAHHAKAINIRTSVLVDAPIADVYAYWRQLDNLPAFMGHLHDVHLLDNHRSHWTVKLMGDLTLEWDAEIVDERENDFFGWRSLEGATVMNAGKVRFRETLSGGTIIYVTISYRPPAGYAGAGLAKLLNPAFARLVKHDVKNFKHHLEHLYG